MVLDFFMYGGTLIVGVDEELRRVYVGQRHLGIYFDSPPEAVDEAIDQWNRSTGHVAIGKHDLDMLRLKREDNGGLQRPTPRRGKREL